MKSAFGRYFCYRLKNSALRTVLMTVLSVMLSYSVIYNAIHMYSGEEQRFTSSGINILAWVLGIAFTLIPILENMEFKNKRNLDTLYFFPIHRAKLALAHFLSGILQAVFVYAVTYLVAGVYLKLNTDIFDLSHLVPYFFYSLLLGLVMYAFFSFIFMQANTVADGVIMCVIWMFVLWLVSSAVQILAYRAGVSLEGVDAQIYEGIDDWSMVYAPLAQLTKIYVPLIEVNKASWNQAFVTMSQKLLSQYYFFIIWGIIGLACTVGYFITFVKKGAQHVGEISDSWLGYRLLIPLCGYSLITIIDDVGIAMVLVFIMMIIGYIIYRRSARIKVRDWIVTGLALVLVLLGM